MRIFFLTVILSLVAITARAQVGLSAGVGISGSVNMGEIGPSPVFKSTLTVGERFRLETGFEFSPMDKYTKAGWVVADEVNFLIFPSRSSGFFMSGGVDFRHRNGGSWAKNGVSVEGGVGYEDAGYQLRFSVKDKVVSLNDDIKYFPYFELLARRDYSIRNSGWSLRTEGELGFFKYIQSNIKRTAFYSNVVLGVVYKWP